MNQITKLIVFTALSCLFLTLGCKRPSFINLTSTNIKPVGYLIFQTESIYKTVRSSPTPSKSFVVKVKASDVKIQLTQHYGVVITNFHRALMKPPITFKQITLANEIMARMLKEV